MTARARDNMSSVSIRLKAALLMVALAALPALLVAQRLNAVNRAALEMAATNLVVMLAE